MNLLNLLSKTDSRIVIKCNNRTKMHQRGLGFFVLVTSLFAFASCFYALTTVYGDWNELSQSYELAGKNQVIVALCSLLYALMIGLIDREIVSSKNKVAALLRIPLAILIGIIISVPIKLKVLEKRINQGIKDEQIAKMLPYKDAQDRFIQHTDSTVNNLELQIAYYTKLKIDEQKRMEAEDLGYFGSGFSGIAGQGERYGYAKSNADNYNQVISDLKESINEKQSYKSERITQMESNFNLLKPNVTYDFWSKYEALHRIISEDPTNQSKMMVWGLSLLFIMLELIPSLIKILTPKNEYDMISEYLDETIEQKLSLAMSDEDLNSELDDYIMIPEIQVT